MKAAKDFLAKFQSLAPPQGPVRKAVVEALKAAAGVAVPMADVTVSRGVAFVRASSVARNAIRLAKKNVLDELYTSMPRARDIVRDIR